MRVAMSERPEEDAANADESRVLTKSRLTRVVFGGEGLSPDLTHRAWIDIREIIYEGRGGQPA
jgi:hypothetical protein